jgi:uncharacterized protein (DUF488 family)
MDLYTIGHSNHSIEQFCRLLDQFGIMILVDVRSAPFSRFNPQFNKETLAHSLDQHNIQYLYAGKYLGGRPQDPCCYKSGVLPAEGTDYLHEVNYREVMKRPWFIKGIAELVNVADTDVTAIMCSEEDPAECHRHHLIAKYMNAEYPEIRVRHIRGDGNDFNARQLLTSVDKPVVKQQSLFGDDA